MDVVGLPDLFRAIDLAGVFLNGILGGLIARSRGFDAVGFAILAIMSALGGGMLRDTLLQAGPPVALTDPYYLWTALAGATVAFLLQMRGKWMSRIIIFADAVVLGCWAATGATKALALGFGIMPALMMGVITAVGGGMIRDVAVGRVPAVFGGNTLYATAAIAASVVMIALFDLVDDDVAMLAATTVGAALCVLARWRSWRLPEHTDWTVASAFRRPRFRRKKRRSPEEQSDDDEGAAQQED